MGNRKINFENGEIYHVFCRGVEKRKIFMDDADRFRLVHNLYEFNDEEPANNLYYKRINLQSYAVAPRK